ncbi:methyltransferase domain-containing protein [Sphingobium sp. H39-3-25]|uniref:class I SAM-dependent methyltransferase n=1 Tax=Sphingobium arseniciresistens TaxID=3030834 RepID=UPI0023B9B69A|nr:methyltransferase domain-containing protein [Sphingobium arseniciresistens]
MLVDDRALGGMMQCPACAGPLALDGEGNWTCAKPGCITGGAAFPKANGRSILVDFNASVLDRDAMIASGADSVVHRRRGFMRHVFQMIDGPNPITPRFAGEMLDRCRALAAGEGRRPRLLIVGGGTIGSGADALYQAEDIDLITFDIYWSEHVSFLADAHAMPLAPESIDGVWIQAVLEHVIDPVQVVSEIGRVLRPGGLVFADTPFLWPVHEKAYDFTRWTPSGHRWLFRNFDVIAAGTSSGPGTLSLLALRHLAASLFRSPKMGQILTFPFAWLRLLDRFCDERKGLDAAAGIFFFGAKTQKPIEMPELIRFYDEQIGLQQAIYRFGRVKSGR